MAGQPPYSQTNPATGFASDDDEAEARAVKCYDSDPLSDISDALLNSIDVIEYIRVAGMVYPFDSSIKALKQSFKTASYEIPLIGDMHWIDENRLHQNIRLDTKPVDGQAADRTYTSFRLAKNQIVFFSPAVFFRLPLYIAFRFNLHISHVHKGLLLGTGPIVDPGFRGRLLIPLHNLTANDYDLKAGEGLIWIEFTKISPNCRWDLRETTRPSNDFVIKPVSNKLSAEDYFKKATGRTRPAESSLPIELRDVRDTAKTAWKLSWGTVIGGLLAMAAMLVSTWSLISDANKNLWDANNKNLSESKERYEKLQQRIADLEGQIKALQAGPNVTGLTSQKADKTADRIAK